MRSALELPNFLSIRAMSEQGDDTFSLSFPLNLDAYHPTVITLPRFQHVSLTSRRQDSKHEEVKLDDDDGDWYANVGR